MMDEKSVKHILRSFCKTGEGDFEVVFATRRRVNIRGVYHRKTRVITIYVHTLTHATDPVAVALHELAHHLLWERHSHMLQGQFHQGKRMAQHGKEFKDILDDLLREFNLRYREHLKGRLVYDRRRPTVRPRFKYFEQTKCV